MGTIERKPICGIDPGQKGGLVILDSNRKIIYKLPFDDAKGQFRIKEFRTALLKVRKLGAIVYLESVHAMFRTSAGSNFSFGHINGIIYGMLYAYKIPFTKMTPGKWQKIAWEGIPIKKLAGKPQKGRGGKDTKAMSLMAVTRLFPSVNLVRTEKCKKAHDGMVDALLMAYYGYTINNY